MPAVLFVCTANRIRSPLAVPLFQRELTTLGENSTAWRVESAGTWTHGGQPAMPLAQQVAAMHGLDISRHRSRSLDDIRLDVYDQIVTMEAGQAEALCVEFYPLASRVHSLNGLVGGIAYDVSDPVGQPLAAYEATFRELEQIIKRAAPNLVALCRGK